MNKYYELVDDRYHPGRWHLRGPVNEHGQKLDPWQFSMCRWLEFEGALRLPARHDGVELDFSWAAFSILVVTERLVRLFERLNVQDVQFIPAQVEGHPGPYFILNPLRIVRCIDDARCSEVRYFKPEDDQPDRVGEYSSVIGMRIDPTQVGDVRIFRTWGWPVALIVSDDLKEAMEREHITGTKFIEV